MRHVFIIVVRRLSANGESVGVDGNKCYVAIKGRVYDVTGNKAYQPGGSYHGAAPCPEISTIKSSG